MRPVRRNPSAVGQGHGGAEQRVIGGGEAGGGHVGLAATGGLEPVALALEGVGGKLYSLGAVGKEGVPVERVAAGVQSAEGGEERVEFGTILAQGWKEGGTAESLLGEALLGHGR